MESLIVQAANTVLLRPYVFLFLLVYLFGCSLHLGVKRAVSFCIAGYLIAWLSEFASIHTGFPYGFYYYTGQTRGQELFFLGVPFMDSLSYVFLAYSSYTMALLVVCPVLKTGKSFYVLETGKTRNSFRTGLLGAFFFVYLDIIIDPVALKGHKWFLGQIYGYPDPGVYFGVPFSNFAGWLIVGFLMISALQRIDRVFRRRKVRDFSGSFSWRHLIGPGLYLGVLLFNLSITFFIGEYLLACAGVFIILLPLVLTGTFIGLKTGSGGLRKAIAAHLRDFPEAAGPGIFPQIVTFSPRRKRSLHL